MTVHIHGDPTGDAADKKDAADDSAIGEHVEVVIVRCPCGREADARLRISWIMLPGTTSYSATATARLAENVAREDARAARSV